MLYTQHGGASVIYWMRIDTATRFLVIVILHFFFECVYAFLFFWHLYYFASSFIRILQCQRLLAKKKTGVLVKSFMFSEELKVTSVFFRLSLMQNQIFCIPPPPAAPPQSVGVWYRVLLSTPSTQLVSCDLRPKFDNNHTDNYLILQSPLMMYLNVVAMLSCYKSFQMLFLNFYTSLIMDW